LTSLPPISSRQVTLNFLPSRQATSEKHLLFAALACFGDLLYAAFTDITVNGCNSHSILEDLLDAQPKIPRSVNANFTTNLHDRFSLMKPYLRGDWINKSRFLTLCYVLRNKRRHRRREKSEDGGWFSLIWALKSD
jgi:hypothetical protein